MDMETSFYIDGILFADVDTAEWYENTCREIGIDNSIGRWRVTSGKRVLAEMKETLIYDERRWRWPVVPVAKSKLAGDCWATGTAYEKLKVNPASVERENCPGNRKLAHHIVWAERREGKLVSDPLRRKVFNRLSDLREYVLSMRNNVCRCLLN